ncbi:MAG: Protein kinase domain protein [Labilithrix sp.]|nr:Protein kinase domain protein [Labilithrix sp.]
MLPGAGPRLALAACAALALSSLALACRPAPSPQDATTDKPAGDPAADDAAAIGDGSVLDAQAALLVDAAARVSTGTPAPTADDDPMANHHMARQELIDLFAIKDFTDEEKKRIKPEQFLNSVFGSEGPGRMSQGNKAIARHAISKRQCLAGLQGVVLQTPEQRAKCGGAENMVPVWIKGKEAWFCIDVFEFPNKACELPFVWTPPTLAKKVCELQGKRLCAQTEWNIACRGDPNGGDDQRYAYGDRLDLDICHTNLRHRQPCVVKDAKSAFDTCTTDTEPSGSYPKCRSRFGVFDQHGNVAEVMMRREGDQVFTQLKGSAWFYNELAKEPGEPTPESTTNKQGAYPDHCNFDPRWHVEPIENAFHVNYHLGFRCCKSIP